MPAGASRDRAYRIAREVLRGKRHRGVGNAMYFHTAGRTYGYDDMHYVAVAGGNAFYERQATPGRAYIPRTVVADAGPLDSIRAPRWPFGGGLGVIDQQRRQSTPPVVEVAAAAPLPQAEPAYVVAPAAPQPLPRPAYVAAPAAPPASIEAIILASNGF